MIKVHGVALSPFVRKVMLTLEYKGVDYENEPVFPGSSDADFRAISPLGKIPVLEHDDFTVPDSSAICRYLDRIFPDPRIYPDDPKKEATALWIEEFADSKLIEACAGLFQQRFLFPKMMGQETDEAVVADILDNKLPPLLDYLESIVPESGLLLRSDVSIADIAVATCFLQARYGDFEPNAEKYPKLCRYLNDILNTNVVKARMQKEAEAAAQMGA